jgi:hypothetical protein
MLLTGKRELLAFIVRVIGSYVTVSYVTLGDAITRVGGLWLITVTLTGFPRWSSPS